MMLSVGPSLAIMVALTTCAATWTSASPFPVDQQGGMPPGPSTTDSTSLLSVFTTGGSATHESPSDTKKRKAVEDIDSDPLQYDPPWAPMMTRLSGVAIDVTTPDLGRVISLCQGLADELKKHKENLLKQWERVAVLPTALPHEKFSAAESLDKWISPVHGDSGEVVEKKLATAGDVYGDVLRKSISFWMRRSLRDALETQCELFWPHTKRLSLLEESIKHLTQKFELASQLHGAWEGLEEQEAKKLSAIDRKQDNDHLETLRTSLKKSKPKKRNPGKSTDPAVKKLLTRFDDVKRDILSSDYTAFSDQLGALVTNEVDFTDWNQVKGKFPGHRQNRIYRALVIDANVRVLEHLLQAIQSYHTAVAEEGKHLDRAQNLASHRFTDAIFAVAELSNTKKVQGQAPKRTLDEIATQVPSSEERSLLQEALWNELKENVFKALNTGLEKWREAFQFAREATSMYTSWRMIKKKDAFLTRLEVDVQSILTFRKTTREANFAAADIMDQDGSIVDRSTATLLYQPNAKMSLASYSWLQDVLQTRSRVIQDFNGSNQIGLHLDVPFVFILEAGPDLTAAPTFKVPYSLPKRILTRLGRKGPLKSVRAR